MKNRNVQSLNVFYPVASAGGQPFDSALLLIGLLYQEDHLSSEFGQQVELLAAQVNLGKDARHLEAMCLDVLSLSKRMNWGQLTTFIQKVESAEDPSHAHTSRDAFRRNVVQGFTPRCGSLSPEAGWRIT